MQIKDRVFIVTGASSGIGLSTAIALSDRGAKVALLARSSDALQELARKLPGSLPVTVDMTRFARVREAVHAVHQHYRPAALRLPRVSSAISSMRSTRVVGIATLDSVRHSTASQAASE